MSLYKKIMSIFTLSLLLTFTPLIFLIHFYIRPINTQQLEAHTSQLIASKANEVGSWLNQRISEIRVINQFPACHTLNYDEIRPYLSELNQVMQQQYGNPEETFAIGSLDGRGWINDTLTIDVSGREYFQTVISSDKEYIISQPIISKSDNNQIFIICYPIRDENGKATGFINGSVNLDRFSQITDSIDIYDGLVWLMNKSGSLYTTSQKANLEKELPQSEIERISVQFDQANSGHFNVIKSSGKNATLFYSSVPYADDWILCTMIDNEQFYASITRITTILIVACIVLIALLLFLTGSLSASVLNPISQLKENMQMVASGHLDSYYQGKGNDEISVLGHAFNQMLTQLKQSIDNLVKAQQTQRQAELRALQSQINPHFLYNTLSTIQWKALEYNAMDIADMIQQLSQFFRLSLNNGREMISIEEELSHVSSYLSIHLVRYGDKLSYDISLSDDLYPYQIPKLILQPLVENSIYHGIKPKNGPGKINIRLWEENDFLYMQVKDDGVGIPEGTLKQLRSDLACGRESNHYGLYNVNERLRIRYAGLYQMNLESTCSLGTAVTLRLPLEQLIDEQN